MPSRKKRVLKMMNKIKKRMGKVARHHRQHGFKAPLPLPTGLGRIQDLFPQAAPLPRLLPRGARMPLGHAASAPRGFRT